MVLTISEVVLRKWSVGGVTADELCSSSLRATDEVFQALEDNQVSLSTMKASHFVRAFEQEVDRWERQLSVVLEVTEMVLTVQRQWIYLEVTLRMMQGNSIGSKTTL